MSSTPPKPVLPCAPPRFTSRGAAFFIQENRSIPILGDVPYLGYLFSQRIKGVQTNELVIMPEPVILEH